MYIIVDDELPIREELQSLDWYNLGCTLLGAGRNGKEALEFCKTHSVDIVIADITMPAMDGISLAHNLQSVSPQSKIIFLTCHNDFSYAQKALHLGAVGYLLKINMKESALRPLIEKAAKKISDEKSIETSQQYMQYQHNQEQLLNILINNQNSNQTIDFLNYPCIPCLFVSHFGHAGFYMDYILEQVIMEQYEFQWYKLDKNKYMFFLPDMKNFRAK